MRSADQGLVLPEAYRAEARMRARMGTPVSGILRDARNIIQQRGWAPRTGDRAFRSGPVDVVMAFHRLGTPLSLVDHYVFLLPIASMVPSSFAAWENRPGLDVRAVLRMMDGAIAFALQAEAPCAEPSVGSRPRSDTRLN